MSEQLNVLVIGAVACGPKAACRLKRLMPRAQVTTIAPLSFPLPLDIPLEISYHISIDQKNGGRYANDYFE